mgnify:CR=1 FL=1
MGIVIDEITPSIAERYNLPVDSGIIVAEVVSGSPAQQDGIQVNDIIIEAADEKVENFEDLRNILFDHRAGDTLKVKLIRDGKEEIIDVVLGELPQE